MNKKLSILKALTFMFLILSMLTVIGVFTYHIICELIICSS